MRKAKQVCNRKGIQIETEEAAIAYYINGIISPVGAYYARLGLRGEHA